MRAYLKKHNIEDINEWVHGAVTDAIKDQVTDQIHQELTGAAAELADTMGSALGVLKAQLTDPNAAIRQRAADKILKYGFELQKQRPHTEESGPTEIKLSVGSTFESASTAAQRKEPTVEHPDPDAPENIDVPMARCKKCHDFKHATLVNDAGLCSSCRMLQSMQSPTDLGNHG